MRTKEVAVHLLFGAITIFFITIALGIRGVWSKLDAGIYLKALIILQVIFVFSFLTTLWRATVLWIAISGLQPWPWRMEGDSARHLQVTRWRRMALYVWCALLLDIFFAAIMM